jgi:hypothetical protein
VCGCSVPDVDTDGDGRLDCVDACPADPTKVAAGACGCGTPDTDTDGDGVADCHDACPADPGKTAPGACGCGTADTDRDGDGTPDCQDPCLGDPNKISAGICGCGHPDADSDRDGVLDCLDGCPSDVTKLGPGVCGCGVRELDAAAYEQNWESGAAGWLGKLGDQPIISIDPTAPSPPHAQVINRVAGGGDYFSPAIPVTAGNTYCVAAWINWTGGGWPSLGFNRLDQAGGIIQENWMMGGPPGTSDNLGGVIVTVPQTAVGWNWYARSVTMPSGTAFIRLKNEAFSGAGKAGATLSSFDDIALLNGPCPAAPPRLACSSP